MYPSDKEQYLLRSKLTLFQRKAKQAEQVCREALKNHERPALSFSGGKDSVVMLDIAHRAGFRGVLVFFKYGICTDIETPQENIDMLLKCSEKYQLPYEILDCYGEADAWEMCGRFILHPETKEEKRIFDLTNHDFAKRSKDFEKENGIDLNFIGMCKSESKARKIMLSKKGQIYKTNSRQSTTCCPIAHFTADDVWAYIFSNDLPYLSIYDYPHVDRRDNRNEITMLYSEAILRHGMAWHYKQMYPDYFDWLSERWGYRP